MANSGSRPQDNTPGVSNVPGVHGYSRLAFAPTSAYGFPQGKVRKFFYPETHLAGPSRSPYPVHKNNSRLNVPNKMPKKSSQTPTLQLGSSNFDNIPKDSSPLSPATLSPLSPKSVVSPPGSPYFKKVSIRPVTARSAFTSEKNLVTPGSPNPSTGTEVSLTAIPPYPPSPKEPTKHGRDQSRSFFANLKASKSTHWTQNSEGSSGQSVDKKPTSRGSSKDRTVYVSNRGRNGSTLDLSVPADGAEGSNGGGTENESSHQQSVAGGKPLQESDQTHTLTTKKSKPRFANILTRTRSIRVDEPFASARLPTPSRRPSNGLLRLEEISHEEAQPPLRTAPLQMDRTFREVVGSSIRNRSTDRPGTDDSNPPVKKERAFGVSIPSSASLSQVSGSSLFNNLKQSSSGAADRPGKAGKGFLGKITRSGSSHERELVITDDNYVCTTISLPLVEQTRRTRISKKLENSKDKTEYWMPALPWRCIDYLNFKGCEEEGLYRVPGSGRDVKHWQRRFDTELDINLFDEPDLYDINTIGSMFKAWLRELPDEIFPKQTQAMVAENCVGATTAPQLLRDELSKLPPYNYYLLFAITCHLSLLHSYVDKNKMDYRNLCICFQPCMKIDAFCFQFLVCDWKNCWQGCWTEQPYLAMELEAERREKESYLIDSSTTLAGTAIGSETERKPKERRRNGNTTAPPEITIESDADTNIKEPHQSEDVAVPPTSVANLETEKMAKESRQTDAGSMVPVLAIGERAVPSSNSSQPHQKSAPAGVKSQSSSRSSSPKRGRQPTSKNLEPSHKKSVSQLPELGPPLSPIKF